MTDIGHGYRVRFTFVRFTPRLRSPGLETRALELASLLVIVMAGVRWATENRLFPRIAEAVTIVVLCTSPTRASPISHTSPTIITTTAVVRAERRLPWLTSKPREL